MAGLFIALFVDKCTACQSHWKSDFGWHRFQKWAYSLALAWGVRGLKILEHLMTFRSSISTGKPEKLLSLMCFFFSVSWSRAYGLCGLSVIVWESGPGAKSCGQPIWLKLGTEVGCHEIFQKPIWLTSLTLSFRVSGGVSFFAPWVQKIQPFRGHFESAIKPNW